MKNIKYLVAFLGFTILATITSCSPEDDIQNPKLIIPALAEDFSIGAEDNTVLNTI